MRFSPPLFSYLSLANVLIGGRGSQIKKIEKRARSKACLHEPLGSENNEFFKAPHPLGVSVLQHLAQVDAITASVIIHNSLLGLLHQWHTATCFLAPSHSFQMAGSKKRLVLCRPRPHACAWARKNSSMQPLQTMQQNPSSVQMRQKSSSTALNDDVQRKENWGP